MPKLAVDVALLPPEEIMDVAIATNKSVRDPRCVFRLNKGDCLPHLSLLQGVLDSTAQENLEAILSAVALQTEPLELSIIGAETYILSDGYIASGFEVSPTPELISLHEEILQRTEGLVGNDIAEEMFFNPPIREGVIEYVRMFRTKKSGKHFGPHLTTSVGGEPSFVPAFPIFFTVSQLALCQLGNAGTCRKVLASFELAKQ